MYELVLIWYAHVCMGVHGVCTCSCLSMLVHVYVGCLMCMFLCVHLCTHVCAYVWTCENVFLCVYVGALMCVFLCISEYACVCVHVYLSVWYVTA